MIIINNNKNNWSVSCCIAGPEGGEGAGGGGRGVEGARHRGAAEGRKPCPCIGQKKA